MKRRLGTLLLLGWFILGWSAASWSVAGGVEITWQDITGWTPAGEAVTYPAEKLWEVIDGAAEQYLSYGVQGLSTCDLAQGDLLVTVSIYDMGSRLNAFGIFGSERSEPDTINTIGSAASLAPPYQALMWKEEYYVKVEVYQGKLDEDTARELLSVLADRLPGSTQAPPELHLLPKQWLVAGSGGYTASGYLGLGELNHCLHARYELADGKEYRVFVLLPESRKSITAIWQELILAWEPATNTTDLALYRKIPYQGVVGVFLTQRGILGVADAESVEEMVSAVGELGVAPIPRNSALGTTGR